LPWRDLPEIFLIRAIGRSGALVDVRFSEHRDMAAAKAFFESAKMVTGIAPGRVTTDGYDSYPRDRRPWEQVCVTATASISTTGCSKIAAASKGRYGVGSIVHYRLTNCVAGPVDSHNNLADI
jgi:hypothetical protein